MIESRAVTFACKGIMLVTYLQMPRNTNSRTDKNASVFIYKKLFVFITKVVDHH
jgi:hypothetical protein